MQMDTQIGLRTDQTAGPTTRSTETLSSRPRRDVRLANIPGGTNHKIGPDIRTRMAVRTRSTVCSIFSSVSIQIGSEFGGKVAYETNNRSVLLTFIRNAIQKQTNVLHFFFKWYKFFTLTQIFSINF